MIKKGFYTIGIALVGTLCSCGPMVNGQYVSATRAPSSTPGGFAQDAFTPFSNTTQQGKYSCPNLDVNNVTPYNYSSYVAGNFRVCSDPQSSADILVNGNEGSGQICVFPVDALNTSSGQSLVWQVNPNQYGTPWYSCQSPSSSGNVFSFGGGSWNAAYIIDGNYAQQMQLCLMYGVGTASCPAYPPYSFGIFR